MPAPAGGAPGGGGGFFIGTTSNISVVIKDVRESIENFPDEIGKAIGQNAKIVLAESIVQIDALIYSMPEGPTYRRTKNLRRSNKIKKINDLAWMVYNDAAYSEVVHDGTSAMSARPWMGNAIELKEQELEENLVNGGLNAFRAGGDQQGQQDVPQDEAPQDEGEGVVR